MPSARLIRESLRKRKRICLCSKRPQWGIVKDSKLLRTCFCSRGTDGCACLGRRFSTCFVFSETCSRGAPRGACKSIKRFSRPCRDSRGLREGVLCWEQYMYLCSRGSSRGITCGCIIRASLPLQNNYYGTGAQFGKWEQWFDGFTTRWIFASGEYRICRNRAWRSMGVYDGSEDADGVADCKRRRRAC